MISGPRVTLCITLYAREGADGQAVVCPLLRGSSPTRGVAPKQHREGAVPFSVSLTRTREVFLNHAHLREAGDSRPAGRHGGHAWISTR
jgi:hypothetical protein